MGISMGVGVAVRARGKLLLLLGFGRGLGPSGPVFGPSFGALVGLVWFRLVSLVGWLVGRWLAGWLVDRGRGSHRDRGREFARWLAR